MFNYMKKLTEVILGVENISDDIRMHQDEMITQIDYINKELGITKKDYRLRTIENEVFIAPVTMPCLLNNEENEQPKFNFVYFGLNPGYGDNHYLEKEAAYSHKGGYFNFYNSYGIYDFLLKENENPYYQRFMKVMFSIFHDVDKSTVSIDDVREKFGHGKLKPSYKNDHLVFRELTKGISLAFPELIPYHSRKFGESLDKLKDNLENLQVYKKYLREILSAIENNLSDNGIVVANGKPVLDLLENYIENKNAHMIYEDAAIKVYKINLNLWVMFKRQMGAQGFELNVAENMKLFGDKIKELSLVNDYKSVAINDYITKKNNSSKNSDSSACDKSKEIPMGFSETESKKSVTLKECVDEYESDVELTDAFNKKQKGIISRVIKEVAQSYEGISGSSKRWFYPTNFEFDKTEVGNGVRTLTYEKLYSSKYVQIALQVYEPSTERGLEVIQKAKNSEFKFNITDDSNSGNMKIFSKDIYLMDSSKSDETIEQEFRTELIRFLDKYNSFFSLELF